MANRKNKQIHKICAMAGICALLQNPCAGALSILDNCAAIGYTIGKRCNVGGESLASPMACLTQDCYFINCSDSCICAPDMTYCRGSTLPTLCDKICNSDVLWGATDSDGVQSGTGEILSIKTCECIIQTQYRCGAGYYNDPDNIVINVTRPSCLKCPAEENTPGNSAPGEISITKCYIPQDVDISDSTGRYSFTDNCFYTN